MNTNNTAQSILLEKLNNRKVQIIISIVVSLIFVIYYLSQNLFYVNNLNDFGEYFIRAENWANGQFHWEWGMDKLLTIIEFLPVYFFPNNFFKIYRAIQIIIILIMAVIIVFYLIKKSEVLPDFPIRILMVIFMLTMPYFVFKTVTVEQSIVFTLMILMFLTTYNNKYLGALSLLLYIARPESLIIFPMYVVLYLIDRKKRKDILINFFSFLILLVLYLYLVTTVLYPGSSIFAGYSIEQHIPILDAITQQDVQNAVVKENIVSKIWSIFVNGLWMLIKSPLICAVFAMVITQNYLLILFFCIGFIFSVFNRKMYIFYVIMLGYVFLIFVYQNFNSYFPTGEAIDKYKDILYFLNKNLQIVNGRDMEYHLFGHSRYRLFLFPSVVTFIIMGIWQTVGFFQKIFDKDGVNRIFPQGTILTWFKKINIWNNQLPKLSTNWSAVLLVIFIFFIFNNFKIYKNFSKEYQFENQMNDIYMLDIYHAGFKIRESHKPNDLVFFAGACISNISLISEFSVFSGTHKLVGRLCDNEPFCFILNHPEGKQTMTFDEIVTQSPTKFVFMDHLCLDYTKTFDTLNQKYLDNLINKFDLRYLDSLDIKYVVVSQKLDYPNLLLKFERNNFFMYLNTNQP